MKNYKKNIKQQEKREIPSIIDFIIELPMFTNLNEEELRIIAGRMNFFELQKGEILFREGDKGNFVCYVVEGILEVLKQTESGKEVHIATIPRKRSIGEMSIIDNTPRSATVRAKTDVALVSLTQSGFDEILEQYPQTGISLLKGLARLLSMNLRKTSSRLADYMLPL